MPGEQSAAEYYHCYVASQRRVERWVQKTDKELRAATGSAAQIPDAAVVNVEKGGMGTLLEDKDLRAELPREELLPQREHQHDDHRRRRSERTSSTPSKHITPSGGRSHSRSRSRPSSGSKKIKASRASGGRSSPTTGQQPQTNTNTKAGGRHGHAHAHPRRESSYSNGDITLSSYLPYGVLPLLYAITGSPALSVVAAILLLALYLYMDYDVPATKKRSSSSS